MAFKDKDIMVTAVNSSTPMTYCAAYKAMNVDSLKKARTALRCRRIQMKQRLSEIEKQIDLATTVDEVEFLDLQQQELESAAKALAEELNYVCDLYEEVAELGSIAAGRHGAGVKKPEAQVESMPKVATFSLLSNNSPDPFPQPPQDPTSVHVLATAPVISTKPVLPPTPIYLGTESEVSYGEVSRSSVQKCTLGKANSILFDVLRCPLRLQAHFTTVEMQLAEAGAGTQVQGEFQPEHTLRMTLCSKLLKSLEKCTEVHTAAVDAAYASGHSWNHVKNVLMSRFCRRSVLRAAYEKEFESLRFSGHAKVDEYLRRVSRLYHLFVDVYKDDKSERRVLIRKIVSVLPADIAARVIERIKSFGRAVDEDWELILPYDFTHLTSGTSTHDTCVEEIIRATCRCAEEVSNIKGYRTTGQFEKKDNVFMVSSGHHHSEEHFDKIPKNVTEWCAKFEKVIYVNGLNLKSVKQLKEVAPKAADIRLCKTNKTGRLYGVLAFNKTEDYEGVPELLEKKSLRERPFTPVKN